MSVHYTKPPSLLVAEEAGLALGQKLDGGEHPRDWCPPNPRNLCTCEVVRAGNHKEVICLSPEVCKFCQPVAGTGDPALPPQNWGRGASAVSSARKPARSPPYTQNTACPHRSLAGCPLRLPAHCLSLQVPEVPRTQLPQGKGFLHPLSLFFLMKIKMCPQDSVQRVKRIHSNECLPRPCPQT